MRDKKDIYVEGGTAVLRSNEDSAQHDLKIEVPSGHMCVIVFLGEKPDTSYWVKITAVREEADAIHVDYTRGKGDIGASMISYPYADRFIPLSNKPVTFNDQTPQWKPAQKSGPRF